MATLKTLPAPAAERNPATKRCPRCGRDLPREAFAKNRSRPDGLQDWCRECLSAAKRERSAADPTVNARCNARVDTPALRAAVLAALPKLADGTPACPICLIRPAERVEHRHLFETEGGEDAPGELRGYLCQSCNITLSQYESRAHELSPADPAKALALSGDVPGALRLTADLIESGNVCRPLARRLTRADQIGPFDRLPGGYRRAAAFIEYPPVRRLMDAGDLAIWAAINEALDAGGNTAELAAIHLSETGYRAHAEARGVDVAAAIAHFASRAAAPKGLKNYRRAA